ncbi:MAG: LTA synthase family protein [Saccharofermentanales bacterium]
MFKKNKDAEAKNNKILIIPQNLALLLFFALSFFYFEMILILSMDDGIFMTGIIYSLIFSIAEGLLVFLVLTLFNGRLRTFLSGLLIFAITVIFISQMIYYKVFITFYSLYSAARGMQVLEFLEDILFVMSDNLRWLILFILPFLMFFFIKKSFRPSYIVKWSQKIFVAVIFLVVFGIALVSINLGSKDQNSPYDMYYKNSYPVYSVLNLGLMTTMRLDVQRSVFGFSPVSGAPDISDTSSASISQNPSGSPSSSGASASSASSTTTPVPTKAPEFNIMDIDFDKLFSQETDKTLKDMHYYFKNSAPTAKNDYTGKFKGYNLILVTAEGYSHYVVDKNITPTLYKMTHEGFNFTNFYNPVWGVSTSDGEYVATTGLIPKIGVWSMLRSGENHMAFAMGNQLKSLGYATYAYHDHSYKYYGRNISHPNLGYIYKGVGNGLDVKKTWPESDLEMMQKSIDDYIGSKNFHAYYMTVSGHLRYSFSGNFIALKNRAIVADLPYNEAGKAYMACQLELDRAMEYLLKRLEEAGIADKTLIAISADHYPYGLKKADLDNLAGHTVETNFELYKSSFILYAKGMAPVTVDRPVSSLDIIPTISNLLGIKFDSRLLMGIDVFSPTDPLVIFLNRSFITDKGKYNAVTKKFELNPGMAVDSDYQKRISAEIDRKFYFSAKILENDYYAKVLKNIK